MTSVLVQRIGGAHVGHQVAGRENGADIVSRDRTPVGPQHAGTPARGSCGKRNVIGDDDVAIPSRVGNPDIGGVRTVINDHQIDQGMRVGPNSTIADHDSAASVTDGDGGDFPFYRAGICIDIDYGHRPTIGHDARICIRRVQIPTFMWRALCAFRYGMLVAALKRRKYEGTMERADTEDLADAVEADRLTAFSDAVLQGAGADATSAGDAARAMLHASLHGIDSHGFRLLPHYRAAIAGGRLNGTPDLTFTRTRPGTGMLDADHAHGARAMYAAAAYAADLARDAGIGAVGVRNSSHFGAAGAYALDLARRGLGAIVFGNSDSLVRLHDGSEKFHGTNPIAVAFPADDNPWLLDMATSAIPWNRVQLYRSLGEDLPPGIASNAAGEDVTDPAEAGMLAPLGGAFGFKGAGLGGVAEIFSAVMTGMRISPDLISMDDPDLSTPRELGAFIIALDPSAFVAPEIFSAGMQHYLSTLRESPPRVGRRVMAPGDREWEEAARRRTHGIAVDPATRAAFDTITMETGIAL